jgi:hypothetical protein
MTGAVNFDLNMRRTDQDRRPPREVVTARILGDPAPDLQARAEALRLKVKPPCELIVAGQGAGSGGRTVRSGGGRS